jgi:hypothetical protein
LESLATLYIHKHTLPMQRLYDSRGKYALPGDPAHLNGKGHTEMAAPAF